MNPWDMVPALALPAVIANHSVSQSHNIVSSHLGLIRCLSPIARVSTQRHIHTFTNELRYLDKIVLPKELHRGWNPEQAWKLESMPAIFKASILGAHG
jgi:hypothetical protein